MDVYMADVIQVGMGDTPTATPKALVITQPLSTHENSWNI